RGAVTVAGEHVTKKAAVGEIPVLLTHLGAGRRQPLHVVGAVLFFAFEPAVRLQLRKTPAYLGERPYQLREVVIAARLAPVDPAGGIVLAIGIVVAVLAVIDLVAGEDQRHALRQQQADQLIAPQLAAQRQNVLIVGRPLDAAIGRDIVVGAVAIVLAVRLVVLALVADEIGEREAV